MQTVNESRAFFNTSFDKRMMQYATAYQLWEKCKKLKPKAQPFVMLTEFTLPSVEAVLQDQPDDVATSLNLELMEYEDELPSDSDSESNIVGVW